VAEPRPQLGGRGELLVPLAQPGVRTRDVAGPQAVDQDAVAGLRRRRPRKHASAARPPRPAYRGAVDRVVVRREERPTGA
jgi:hypothetical protein